MKPLTQREIEVIVNVFEELESLRKLTGEESQIRYKFLELYVYLDKKIQERREKAEKRANVQ